MTAKNQNGQMVTASIRQEENGNWSARVWFGTRPATEIRRYEYDSRAHARRADISDEIGKNGRVA